MRKSNPSNLFFIIPSMIAIIPSLILVAIGQTEPIDRTFQKDFCQTEDNLLGGIQYTNGNDLSYDSSGCPISTKVIHDWNNISIANQNIINARMTANGYTDVTNTINIVPR